MKQDVLDLRGKGIESFLENVSESSKRFVLAEAELLNRKEVMDKIKEEGKAALVPLEWKDIEEVEGINKGVELFLKNDVTFGIAVDITKRNYIYIEEISEFLANKNVRNIFFCMPEKAEEMVRFEDIKDGIMNAVNSCRFKINLEGFPFCFLDENKNHATCIMRSGKKLRRCALCDMKDLCEGISEDYLRKFGSEEIYPLDSVKEKITNARKRINRNSSIYVSDDEMYYFLHELKKERDFLKATDRLGYPLAIAMEILNETEKEGIVAVEGEEIKLNIEIRKGKGSTKEFSRYRLWENPDASQLLVKQEDIEKRVEYIIEKCPSGGKIVFLGDDDFVSLSMASRNHFERVAVIEFDERIAGRIREISEKEGFDIEVIMHDLRKRLPEHLIRKFDVFCTDSPYSVSGFMLFISRGVELLKDAPKKHGFASFSCEMPETEGIEMGAQQAINKMRLFIERKELEAGNVIPDMIKKNSVGQLREKLARFKELGKQERWYLGALARKEYLYHFLTTNQTRPLIKGDFDGELYFTDLALNFYVDDEMKKETRENAIFRWKDGDKESKN